MRERPLLIGVAGGSGAGKTSVVRRIVEGLGGEANVAVVHHDAYYRDRSALAAHDRDALNFDHPDALETELLVGHLDALVRGETVGVPVYDFASHVRRPETRAVAPRPVVVVEGILLFCDARVRDRLDLRLFVDAEPDVRLARRLRRDLAERGRTAESVLDQYMGSVRRMHLEFVEPSRELADLILPRGADNEVGIQTVVAALRARCALTPRA